MQEEFSVWAGLTTNGIDKLTMVRMANVFGLATDILCQWGIDVESYISIKYIFK